MRSILSLSHPDPSLDPQHHQRSQSPAIFDSFNIHTPHTNVNPDIFFFNAFPDTTLTVPIHMSSYPYSLSESGSMDILNTMSLQHNLLELDVLSQLSARDDLSSSPHDYTSSLPEPQPQPPPQHFSPPQVQSSQSPELGSKNAPFPILSSAAQTNGHAHTMLPPMIHPNPADPTMQFDSETRTFNQRVANPRPSQADPYAPGFLQQQLGEEKWNIFSARLSERRLGQPKSRPRLKSKDASTYVPDLKSGGATSVDFLVKVEVVKEILRTYVPHPYNPLKSLTHPFQGSPTGSVTLTRSTVLLLSGWSNTQFSYWARRAEAIAVLGQHDTRLRAVGIALERRLRGEIDLDTPFIPGQEPISPDGTQTTLTGDHDDQYLGITGKGLDIIIDDVKKRTGASQFLRGKHSSLDPYGSSNNEMDDGQGTNTGPPPAVVFNATFQAMEYTHSPPPPALPPSAKAQRRHGRSRRASKTDSALSRPSGGDVLEMETHSSPHLSFTISESRALEELHSPSPSTSARLLPADAEIGTNEKHALTCSPTSRRPRRVAVMKTLQAQNPPNQQKSRLPVSDSRSEVDGSSPKRKCNTFSEPNLGSPPQKKMR